MTNAAFLLASAFAFARWRERGGGGLLALAPIVIPLAIGGGSFLFRSFAFG